MTVTKFGDLYTSGKAGEETLSCYNLESLVLPGALCRVNKVSENGVSLTIGLRLTEDYESKVSKGAKEKGTNPVKTSKGEILIFQVNSSVKDDRKPEERNGRCQTLIDAFTGKMKKGDETITLHENPIQDGSIIWLTFDGEQIPMKGLINPKSLKAYLADEEDSILFFEAADPSEEGEMEDEEREIYEALKNAKVPTQSNYGPKKTYSDLIGERIAYLDSIMKDSKGEAVLKIAGYLNEPVEWIEIDGCDGHWTASGEGLKSVIASMLNV